MKARVKLPLSTLVLGLVVLVPRSSASDVSGSVTPAATSVAPPMDELCQMESFKASCAADEVILMRESRLGRLKLGRCVKDYSPAYPINCTVDVKPEMDQFCSGRRQCEVRIDDTNFRRPSPCPRDLKVHLWASYGCRKVTIPKTSCRQTATSYTINGVSGGGWLASQTTEDTGCGLTETPWIIQVGAGQRINITMYDMSYDSHSLHDLGGGLDDLDSSYSVEQQRQQRQHQYPKTCRVFATIREPSRGTTSTVCGSQGRVVNVFTSDGDRIELRIMTTAQRPSTAMGTGGQQAVGGVGSATSRNLQGSPVAAAAAGAGNVGSSFLQTDPYFLFRYDVLGCPDPVANLPEDRTLRRRTSTDTMTVSCVGTDVTWSLQCIGNEWVGSNAANCSDDITATLGQPAYPVALSGIVVIIIAIFVSSVILLIGIVCIKWRMKKEFVRRQRLCQSDYDPAAYGLGSVMTSQGGGKSRTMLDGSYAGGGCSSINGELHGGPQDSGYSTGAGSRNEYARMRLQQQQQQQRMCSHYTGGPCGYESGVIAPGIAPYGHPGNRLPSSPSAGSRFVEHIYESPDTLRRENNNGPPDEHYTPTVPFDGAAWGPATTGYPMRLQHQQQQQQQHWQQPGCGGAGYYPPSTPNAAVHQTHRNPQQSTGTTTVAQPYHAASPSNDTGTKNKGKKNAGNYSL